MLHESGHEDCLLGLGIRNLDVIVSGTLELVTYFHISATNVAGEGWKTGDP
jgi:hypothetical protein